MIEKLHLVRGYYAERIEDLQEEIESVVGTKEQFRVSLYLEGQGRYEGFIILLDDLIRWEEEGEPIGNWEELAKQLTRK